MKITLVPKLDLALSASTAVLLAWLEFIAFHHGNAQVHHVQSIFFGSLMYIQSITNTLCLVS